MTDQAPAPMSEPPKRVGRPPGRKNYDGWSKIAQAFKDAGVWWADEMARAYVAYREDPSEANRTILQYWKDVVPYVATRSEDRWTGRGRRLASARHGPSRAALERLAEAEGRRA